MLKDNFKILNHPSILEKIIGWAAVFSMIFVFCLYYIFLLRHDNHSPIIIQNLQEQNEEIIKENFKLRNQIANLTNPKEDYE